MPVAILQLVREAAIIITSLHGQALPGTHCPPYFPIDFILFYYSRKHGACGFFM
jgi:hypothetical protein